jgi:16S rRNA (cytosine967-C5)-methyltransferase
MPANARELAYAALRDYRAGRGFASDLLAQRFQAENPPPEERRLAVEIAYGVIRRQASLDTLLAPLLRRPRHAVEDDLWTVLQIGAYQLAMLDAIPDYAAVSETVKLAGRHGSTRWEKFVNGVLRPLGQRLTNDPADGPAANALPLTDGRYRRLREAFFPDPASDPTDYLVRAFSFPRRIVRGWLERYDFAEAMRLAFWFNTPPPLWLRANLLADPTADVVAVRSALIESFRQAGVEAEAGELPESVLVRGSARIEQLPGFAGGRFAVQDLAAMHAAHWLDPRPGETALDLCAAPGTKTTHLAERMRNIGRIVATDVRSERLARVEENCRRLGVTIVETALIAADGSDTPPGPFDAVLLDVPCSNSGVLGRRPEARWRVQADDITELAALQRRLLGTACERVRPGGRVLYSTCSIEPAENRAVVDALLTERSDFELVRETTHIPGRPADGGYLALLRRSSSPRESV